MKGPWEDFWDWVGYIVGAIIWLTAMSVLIARYLGHL